MLFLKHMDNSADMQAGVDCIRLDTRNWDIAKDDIAEVCRAFRLGNIKRYEKEPNIAVSHSNFFVFLATTRGAYAIKLYPANEEKALTAELILNRLLIKNKFPTPAMHLTIDRSAFLRLNQHRAACFDFINGEPVYRHRLDNETILQINERILQLKEILSRSVLPTRLLQTTSFPGRITSLLQTARQIAPFDGHELIDRSLILAHELFAGNPHLFERKPLHNIISLANLFRYRNKIYILDRSHIKADYELSDLASLVISCLFLSVPRTAIRSLIKKYLMVHKTEQNKSLVLTACLQLGLTQEYLKTVRRYQNISTAAKLSKLDRSYRSRLNQRIKLIRDILKEFQSNTKPPFYP